MESQSVLPSVKYECSKSACFAEEFYWFGFGFFSPWRMDSSRRIWREGRKNAMCLWVNINKEVSFCAKPEHKPPSSSDEELGGLSALYRLPLLSGTSLAKSPWLLFLSRKWSLMQNLQLRWWGTEFLLMMEWYLKRTKKMIEDKPRDDPAQNEIRPAWPSIK